MRLQWKQRFLTTGPSAELVHSILKNISFQKKKEARKGFREERRQEIGQGNVSLLCFYCKQKLPGFGFFLVQKNSFYLLTF